MKSISCYDARKRIFEYLNGQLDEEELKSFLKHVENCPDCMEELKVTHMVYSGARSLDSEKDEELNLDGSFFQMLKNAKRYLLKGDMLRTCCIVSDALVFWALTFMLIMQFCIWFRR